MKNDTRMERTSDRELRFTRTIDGPARLVFEAWTKADLFKRWWVPKSAPITLLSCDVDARVGGSYRLVFSVGAGEMAFFGKYLEVTPHSRLSWTNEEGGPDAMSVTTVTLEERGDKTIVVVTELHPSKEALDAAIGSADGMPETLDQLNELIVGLRSQPTVAAP